MKRLWEVDHPYYATEGNYYARPMECHQDYGSWDEFLSEQGDADLDMNLVYRWDWQVPDPDDYTYERKDDPEFEMPPESLSLFYIGQRKALARSCTVTSVSREDEPRIREWLTIRAEHMRLVWEPLLDREVTS